MLLAATLRQQLGDSIELVAALPQPVEQGSEISSTTRSLLDTFSIRAVPVKNEIDINYTIGNKVACLAVETNAEKTVFLDSDILCLRPFPDNAFQAPFSAKPADMKSWPGEVSFWQDVYSLFDMKVPERRMLSSCSGELMPPCFNTGVIAVQDGAEISAQWQAACIRISQADESHNKDHRLEQIALPVAITRLGLNFQCLAEDMNYPVNLKPLPESLPSFCQYDRAQVLREEPRLNQVVSRLAKTYPAIHELIINGGKDWLQLLEPSQLTAKSHKHRSSFPVFWKKKKTASKQDASLPNDLLLTGIPRSGTSLLCRLLHEQQNSVVINEPEEIFEQLQDDRNPWWIATYYRHLRNEILEGGEIENKIVDGKIIEDTRYYNERSFYQPKVEGRDFLLGTKNTLAYMGRLSTIFRAMPHARYVASIRHPLDAIASWKSSFPHLKHADFNSFPRGFTDSEHRTSLEKQQLQEIVDEKDFAVKRALLWRFLADKIIANEDRFIVIRYEDLVHDPVHQLQRIFAGFPAMDSTISKIEPLSPRSQRNDLGVEDLMAIRDICQQQANHFGYTFGDNE